LLVETGGGGGAMPRLSVGLTLQLSGESGVRGLTLRDSSRAVYR
jgi:hypothetical protein